MKSSYRAKQACKTLNDICSRKVNFNNILVNIGLVSLFTTIMETLGYIGQNFPIDITALLQQFLTTTYFQWNKEYYVQMDSLATENPLSQVINNYYMLK